MAARDAPPGPSTWQINSGRPARKPAGCVRGMTIKLLLSGQGQVYEAIAYVERRMQGGALLGRRTGKEMAA